MEQLGPKGKNIHEILYLSIFKILFKNQIPLYLTKTTSILCED
jgi:hypothetical protein